MLLYCIMYSYCVSLDYYVLVFLNYCIVFLCSCIIIAHFFCFRKERRKEEKEEKKGGEQRRIIEKERGDKKASMLRA